MQRVPDPGGHLPGAGVGGVRQQDGELVAAHPGQEVARPQGLLQARTHQRQQVVADGVPEAVVDLLEPVQVDHHDRAPAVVGAVDRALQLLGEPAPVGQARERVVVGLPGQLLQAQLLGRAQLGVLDHQRALEGDLPDGLVHRRGPLQWRGDGAGHDQSEQPVAGQQGDADVGVQVQGGDQPGVEQVAGPGVLHEDRPAVADGCPPQRDVVRPGADHEVGHHLAVLDQPLHVQDRRHGPRVVDEVGSGALGAGQVLHGAGQDLRRLLHPDGAGPVDEHLPDGAGRAQGGRARLAGPGLLDEAAQVRAAGGGQPAHVLGEGAQPGAVEREDAGDLRPSAQGHGEGGGDGEVVHPPPGQQGGAPVGDLRFPGAQDRLGQRERLGGGAELPPGVGVATARRRSWPCAAPGGRPQGGRHRPARPRPVRRAAHRPRRAGGPSTAPARRPRSARAAPRPGPAAGSPTGATRPRTPPPRGPVPPARRRRRPPWRARRSARPPPGRRAAAARRARSGRRAARRTRARPRGCRLPPRAPVGDRARRLPSVAS